MGKGGRAWQCQRTNGDTQERNDWKQEQLALGRLPGDWVSIEVRGLPRKEALELEHLVVSEVEPRLNRLYTQKVRGTKHELFRAPAKALRKMGYSYRNISYLLGCDTSAMWSWTLINDNK
jgi:hypothetical protein